jgi:hypothetical protein
MGLLRERHGRPPFGRSPSLSLRSMSRSIRVDVPLTKHRHARAIRGNETRQSMKERTRNAPDALIALLSRNTRYVLCRPSGLETTGSEGDTAGLQERRNCIEDGIRRPAPPTRAGPTPPLVFAPVTS